MSEILYTSTDHDKGIGLPAGYEKLDGIKVLNTKDGTLSFSGLIELGEDDNKIERTVQKLPDLAEMWGYDAEESLADWQARKADPEKWDLKMRVQALEEQVAALLLRDQERETVHPPEPEPVPIITPEPLPITPEPVVVVGERWYTRPRNWLGGLAVAGALTGAVFGIWNYHELEELEHRQATADNIQPNHFLERQNSILQRKVTKLDIQATKNARAIHQNYIDIHRYGNHILHQVKANRLEDKKEDKAESRALEHSSGYSSLSSNQNSNAELSYRGDTVINEVTKRVREKLGYRATNEKIRKATAYVLRSNNLRWNGGGYGVDAHRLPVGFRFKIPENITAIANK